MTFDRGSEFIGHDFKDMLRSYGITKKPITVRNPQANSVVERVHQVLGNMMRTFELQENYLDEDDPFKGLLSAAAFAIRATYHTTLQKSPGQLVFGRDMVFNVQHVADWELIRACKQKLIKKNNEQENKTRIPHTYQVGDLVMFKKGAHKYEQPKTGPHEVRHVFMNGTVWIRVGAVEHTVNIRQLEPLHPNWDAGHGGECSMQTARARRRAQRTG